MSNYPDSVHPGVPSAPWMQACPEPRQWFCTTCNLEMVEAAHESFGVEGAEEDEWYAANRHGYLSTAGKGEDGELYCSDSCRLQAAYLAATPRQRCGLWSLVHAALLIKQAGRDLGLDRDGSWKALNSPIEALLACHAIDYGLLRRWLSASDADDAVTRLVRAASDLYDAMHGTADNEQPRWAYEVEGE